VFETGGEGVQCGQLISTIQCDPFREPVTAQVAHDDRERADMATSGLEFGAAGQNPCQILCFVGWPGCRARSNSHQSGRGPSCKVIKLAILGSSEPSGEICPGELNHSGVAELRTSTPFGMAATSMQLPLPHALERRQCKSVIISISF
jgi:hypothetical protein